MGWKVNNSPLRGSLEGILEGIGDWFQMTLYTRVIVNITKRMKKAPVLQCTFLHQYLNFFNYPTTTSTLSKFQWNYIKDPNVDG